MIRASFAHSTLACVLKVMKLSSPSTDEPPSSSLNRSNPDVILLDVSMPAENGHTVTRVLKRTPETMLIQIIVMTANSSPEHFDEAMRAGACAFLEKPFEDGVVLPLIDSAEPLPPVFMEDALVSDSSRWVAP